MAGRRHRLQELEVGKMRMGFGEVDLALHPDAVTLGGDTGEGDALGLHADDAVEVLQEVEMPEGPAELAIGHGLEADGHLLLHEIRDLAVLDRRELGI